MAKKVTGQQDIKILERIAFALERIADAIEMKDSGPKCPKCGSFMVEKQNKSTGSWFWGCTNWPECKATRPMAVQPQEGKRSESRPFAGAPGPGYSEGQDDDMPF